MTYVFANFFIVRGGFKILVMHLDIVKNIIALISCNEKTSAFLIQSNYNNLITRHSRCAEI